MNINSILSSLMLLSSTTVDPLKMALTLMGGIGALLVGFKLLSENIEKISSVGLKKLFNKTSNNRFVGVGIGALVTAIIQSSGATTIMIIGFVNAGIMNLFQATSMIMGANIGTTITAHIASLQNLPITLAAGVLALIGMLMEMLVKNDKVKTWGLILAGLGLVFVALKIMSGSMSDISEIKAVRDLLSSVGNPIILFLIGTIITALVQSSSAVTSIIITMYGAGLTIGVSANSVLFLILGTNVGTCITAVLSSVGANVNAKRASFIHFLFNFFGSILFFVILLFWKNFYSDILEQITSDKGMQIAMFHTFFNIVCTLLFVGIIKAFVWISEIVIRDRKENKKTTYLDERLIHTPSIALDLAVKETVRLGELAMNTLDTTISKFIKRDTNSDEKLREQVADIEILNREIIAYLVKVSAEDITYRDEQMVSALHNVLNDFIREAEIADNIIKYTNGVIKNDIVFSESVNESIIKMQSLLKIQFENIKQIILYNDLSILSEIKKVEDQIDLMRNQLIDGHIKRLEEGKCKPQSSGVFINLISNLERAGDHLDYVAEIIVNANK